MARSSGSESRERHWRGVIKEWQQSGQSVRAFCASRNLSIPTFYGWRAKILGAVRVRRQFLPVRVITEQPAPQRDGSGIEIVLGNGHYVRILPGFDQSTLGQMLDVLNRRGPSC
jgi:hypothetical protein